MPVTWISIEKKNKGKKTGVPHTDANCHLFLKVTDSVNTDDPEQKSVLLFLFRGRKNDNKA